jgi:hypothetical protein
MKLPNEPETVDAARARYPDAVAYAFTHEARRRHTFDFDDGLRLIVSHERFAAPYGSSDAIHISASFHPNTPIERRLFGAAIKTRMSEDPAWTRDAVEKFLDMVPLRWGEISGRDAREAMFAGLFEGIPHWIARVAPPVAASKQEEDPTTP